jgi:hypothetical protein
MRIAPFGGQRDHEKPGLRQAYGEMVGMQGEQPVKLCFQVFKGPDQKGTGRAYAVPAHDCGTVTCSIYKIYRGKSPVTSLDWHRRNWGASWNRVGENVVFAPR